MRFMLCARDRGTGEISLLSHASFLTRREAVEAISAVGDFTKLEGLDVFLVDLDVAVPVAVVPWHADEAAPVHGVFNLDESLQARTLEEASASEAEAPAGDSVEEPVSPTDEGVVLEEIVYEDVVFDDAAPVDEASVPAEYDLEGSLGPMVFDMGASLGLVQIDIDEWTCEDCIYVSTCAFSGSRRPAACGAFQWRA